ncbi:MAG: universal stress protein [Rubrivivax sp.]|nr:universal stress protein [Rubrivivax sp.]
MKVLLAVDGSAYTQRMLTYIVTQSDWLGSKHRYTVIHCVAAVPHRAAAFLDSAQVRDFYAEDAEAVLAPVRSFLAKEGIEAKYVHRIGPAATNIARLAQQGKFDLVMMGTQGRGAIGGVLLGSVATKVLSLCCTPVLLIR